MKLLIVKHFLFDDESAIVRWSAKQGHTAVTLYSPDESPFPPLASFDMLVILGGPMSVYQEAEYGWLRKEKQFIENAIRKGKWILGICLGAQMLAEVLGSKVYRNEHKEIGWQKVTRTEESHILFEGVADQFKSFHWHADTFELPEGAVCLAYSQACRNQAFAYSDHILGLQFHLETTRACMEKMLTQWSSELIDKPYIQKASQMMKESYRCADSEAILKQILDRFEECIFRSATSGGIAKKWI